jgi:hypothetical protein
MSKEIVHWYSVEDDMPDDYETVLVYTPGTNEPVWLGYHDSNDGWCYVDGCAPTHTVTHWATMPAGPKKTNPQTERQNDDQKAKLPSC